jgi:hypothetical protein
MTLSDTLIFICPVGKSWAASNESKTRRFGSGLDRDRAGRVNSCRVSGGPRGITIIP